MNYERRFINLSITATVLAVSILPNLSERTPTTLTSLITNEPPNCTQIGPDDTFKIAVFGSGVFVQNGHKKPDHAGMMRLKAAAEYYRQNKKRVEKIIILDGNLYPKAEEISKRYLLEVEPSIPSEIIESEQNSTNTPTNADELRKLTAASDQIVGITSDSHIDRATKYICAKGRKAIGLSAEKILKIPVVTNSNTIIKEKLALLFSIFFDDQGWIITQFKSF